MDRTAVFRAGAESRSVLLDDDNACGIPWEVLVKPNVLLQAGVCGARDGEVVLPTVWADLGVILTGAAPGREVRPPTPELWRQELERKGDALCCDGRELTLKSGDRPLATVWIEGDPSKGSPSGPTLEEYDTDDGWHVRKWSDGYVEMTAQAQKNVTAFGTWGSSLKSADILKEPKAFPVPLVKKYAETVGVVRNDAHWSAWPVSLIAEGTETLRETNSYGVLLGYSSGSPSSGTIAIAISVTGRWK